MTSQEKHTFAWRHLRMIPKGTQGKISTALKNRGRAVNLYVDRVGLKLYNISSKYDFHSMKFPNKVRELKKSKSS